MGKHFWSKRMDDDSSNKRSSWSWGLVHSLGYHHWRLNIKKMIKYHKDGTQTHDFYNLNPVDDLETKGLLDESEKLFHSTETFPATKKRSIRARIKAFITEEVYMGRMYRSKQNGGSSHRGKGDDRKHPIIFVRKNLDDCVGQPESETNVSHGVGVLDIFRVDKELLEKHLQDADEGIASFSRSALRSNSKSKFSRSRSFPVAIKPVTLENKQKDAWFVPKEEARTGVAVIKITEKREGDDSRKAFQRRCILLNDSFEKYTRLFENMSFCEDFKLSTSRSLRLSFRQKRSLSNADFYSSDLSSEIMDENTSQDALFVAANGSSLAPENIEEDEAVDVARNGEEKTAAILQSEIPSDVERVVRTDPIMVYETGDQFVDVDEFRGPEFVLNSRTEDESPVPELDTGDQVYTSNESPDPEMVSKLNSDEARALSAELKALLVSFCLSSTKFTTGEDSGNNETEPTSCTYTKNQKKVSDLEYVRQILDQSGLATDPLSISWHASDQPLSPRVFEELEARCCHEQGEEMLDICGCWHHQLMFDLVNEMLVDIYDISSPYYPNPLFLSCNVHPFPIGNHMIEEVSSRAGCLLDLKPEDKQSMNSILEYDMKHDRRWMNLHMEVECVALSVEDMLFDELLEELIYSH